jgi:lactose/L-arabinose transport system ATP-binding protein
VFENVAYGLRVQGRDEPAITRAVGDVLELVGLGRYERQQPHQLSGGEQQRVALARAVVFQPQVLLFDEPLSNLDAELRVSMRIEIARLHRELGNTMIYVTHDQTEAMTLADKIVVLRDGRVEQAGTPREIYENPSNTFVAGFIGSPRMNLLNARWGEGRSLVEVAGTRIESGLPPANRPVGAAVTLGLRPEHLKVASDLSGSLTARVDFSEYLGGTQYLYCQLADGQSLTVEHRSPISIAAGEQVSLLFEPSDCRLFDEGGNRLR